MKNWLVFLSVVLAVTLIVNWASISYANYKDRPKEAAPVVVKYSESKFVVINGVECIRIGSRQYKKAALSITCNWDKYNEDRRVRK